MSKSEQREARGDERCFACGRKLRRVFLADTRDAQIVLVGPECIKHVNDSGEAGYQPPKGGPRLYPVLAFKDWAGELIVYRFSKDDEKNVVCEVCPHGDSWQAMGRARSEDAALQLAVNEWNKFDSAA